MSNHETKEKLAHYRHVLDDAMEAAGSEFTTLIAEHVHAEVRPFYSDLSTNDVSHVIECALSKFALLLRRGIPVTLEHIGMLLPADVVGDRRMIFRPCKTLFKPFGDPPRLVILDDARQAQGGEHV